MQMSQISKRSVMSVDVSVWLIYLHQDQKVIETDEHSHMKQLAMHS